MAEQVVHMVAEELDIGVTLHMVVQEVVVQFVSFGLVHQDNSQVPVLAHHK